MTETKKPLSGVLNVRVDEPLEREIERIAKLWNFSASETARVLLRHGVDVERQTEASMLRFPIEWDQSRMRGRIVIEAKFEPYTRREWMELQYPDSEDVDDRAIWFDTPAS